MIQWHMSSNGPFWLQGGLGKNPMLGWDVGCTVILTTWKVNWVQVSSLAILGDLLIGAVEWECTVICDSQTTRQEAESLKGWRVMRVFKGSKQLSINQTPFAVPLWQILPQRDSQEPRPSDICTLSKRFLWIRLYLETNRLSTSWLARPIWSRDICHRIIDFDRRVPWGKTQW